MITANTSLIDNYFSFCYSHSYGYDKKKELRSDKQAGIFAYLPNS